MDVMIAGNVVADPELKISDKGTAVCSFRIAVGERRKNAEGIWEDAETMFISCKAFGAYAEHCANTLSKGVPVIATGRQTARTVEKNGTKTTYYTVLINYAGVDVKRSLVANEPADPWASQNSPF